MPRHERAGRADRLVDKADRLGRLERASDAVVIEDLEDVGILGTVDRLTQLIVVDEHQLGFGRIDQIRFADGSDQLA